MSFPSTSKKNVFPKCRLTGTPLTEIQFAGQWAYFAKLSQCKGGDGQAQGIPRDNRPPANKSPYVARVAACIEQGHSQRETAAIVGCSSGCVSQIVSREKMKVQKRKWANSNDAAIEAMTPAVVQALEAGSTQREIVELLGVTRYCISQIMGKERNRRKEETRRAKGSE